MKAPELSKIFELGVTRYCFIFLKDPSDGSVEARSSGILAGEGSLIRRLQAKLKTEVRKP